MMRLKGGIPWVYLLLLIGTESCNITEPSYIDRPALVKHFSPKDRRLTVFLDDSLLFTLSASDPDGKKIRQYFMLDDSLVAEGAEWLYIVQDTGLATITGVATDGHYPQHISWELDRLKPVNLKPVIKSFDPPDSDPIVIIGNQLDFSIQAEDPEGKSLSYFYTVDDVVVTVSRRYSFVAVELGDYVVKAVVSDGEKFNSKTWTVHVSEVPDLIPPAPVEIVSVETGQEPGELVVQWIAVGADSMEGLPAYYRLRTSSREILIEEHWDQASDRPGEPPPATPGEIQTMVVADLPPAELVYVSVRAVDEFGNMSELGNSMGNSAKGNEVYGRIINSVTGDPIEGIRVWFEGLSYLATFSDAQGRFAFTELPRYDNGNIIIDDEDNPYSYGTYFRFEKPYTVVNGDNLNFSILPNVQLDTTIYPDFLNFFINITSHSNGNYLRTWDIPVDIYVKPFVKDSLDYRTTVIGILDEYEANTGMDLFNLVSGPPALGLEVIYDDPAHDEYSILEWSTDIRRLPVRGRITFRTCYSAGNRVSFQKVIRHELGHALGMSHSLDTNHIMYGGAAAPYVFYMSQDELILLKSMYRLPRGMPSAYFYAN
jgi:hypothetical protein